MTLLQQILLAALLLVALGVPAKSSFSEDSLRHIYREMRLLYHIGIDIHQRYDLNVREQVGACNFEVGHNGSRARALVGMANRIEYPNKKELVQAAWAVYACSSCRGDGKACDTIAQQLDNIQQVIESGQYQ